jgi:hypothetical protein
MKHTRNAMQEDARRTRRRLWIAVGLVVLGGVWVLVGDELTVWAKGLRRFRGEWIWQGGEESRLGEIDLRDVHQELLGDWVVSMGRSDAAEVEAFAVLSGAVASSPGLQLAAEDLRSAARRDDPEDWLVAAQAWTETMTTQGLPWRIEGAVTSKRAGSGAKKSANKNYYVRVYEVLARGVVEVASAPRPVQFLRRADHLNVVEARLGHTLDAEGIGYILIDRVTGFAIDDIWPLLSPPEPDGPAREWEHHRDSLLASLSRSMPAEDLEILVATAPRRAALLHAKDSLNARRPCSRYGMSRVPWHGFSTEDLDRFDKRAGRQRHEKCPDISLEEAATFRAASEDVASTAGLDRALAALVGHISRGVALHEAVHVAEQGADRSSVALERSAYLASFSHADLGPAAFLQACIGASGAHQRALEQTGLRCDNPPQDLPDAIAEALRAEGHDGPPVIAPDLALRLPLREQP